MIDNSRIPFFPIDLQLRNDNLQAALEIANSYQYMSREISLKDYGQKYLNDEILLLIEE